MHLLGKHLHQSVMIGLWLEHFCLLEGLEEQFFCTETTLQPLLKCRKQGIFLCHTVEAHSCLLNMNMTFDLTEIEMMPQ